MKKITFIILVLVLLGTYVRAELSVVWDLTYDDIEVSRTIYSVALGNGNFLCFYVTDEGDHYYLHAIELDADGTLLNTMDFADPMMNLYTVAIRESVDGGALAAIQSDDGTTLYRISAAGDFVDTVEFAFSGNMLYDLVQRPDGSIIFAGNAPDLICVTPDLNVEWYHNYWMDGDYSYVSDIVQRPAGDYACYLIADNGSAYDYFFTLISDQGDVLHFENTSYNREGFIASQFDDNIVYLYNTPGHGSPSWLKKHGAWLLELPNDPGDFEWYFSVQPFNGIPGYFCSGYVWDSWTDYHAIFLQVAENGVPVDTLDWDGLCRPFNAAAMDGGVVAAGYTRTQDTITALRAVRLQPDEVHAPVSVKMWLHNPSVRVSSGGGPLHYRLLISNDLDLSQSVRLEFTFEHTDSTEWTVEAQEITLLPHQPVVIPHDQISVPGTLAAGTYLLRAKVYDHEDVLLSQCMLKFNKAPAVFTADVSHAEAETDSHPVTLTATPNPFNAATTINVTLPQSAPLTVRVFDIQGRTVATLAEGSTIPAGTRSFSFDGSNLSSGIYFVQATVPGQLNEVQKLVLVK